MLRKKFYLRAGIILCLFIAFPLCSVLGDSYHHVRIKFDPPEGYVVRGVVVADGSKNPMAVYTEELDCNEWMIRDQLLPIFFRNGFYLKLRLEPDTIRHVTASHFRHKQGTSSTLTGDFLLSAPVYYENRSEPGNIEYGSGLVSFPQLATTVYQLPFAFHWKAQSKTGPRDYINSTRVADVYLLLDDCINFIFYEPVLLDGESISTEGLDNPAGQGGDQSGGEWWEP